MILASIINISNFYLNPRFITILSTMHIARVKGEKNKKKKKTIALYLQKSIHSIAVFSTSVSLITDNKMIIIIPTQNSIRNHYK